ncbi:primase C-terminal domain-containing protein (plasmid) [Paenibacillus sp. EC2-1]|uniref:primase C-terminal domain-containing protein n=1 Tax=Paenibacillus sp. EC2-1 TaxID=3388665 RepID=UPI003BEF22F4
MSDGKECREVEMGVSLPSGSWIRNIYKHVSEIPDVRKRYKNKGVYVSAYRYSDAKDKANSLLYGDPYIDLDITDLKDPGKADEAFSKIREDAIKVVSYFSAIFGIDEKMIKIYYSGQKGLHVIVPARILGIKPMQELHGIFRLIALDVHNLSKNKTIDTGIYDNARLFSLPGVKHPVTGRHKIPLTYEELRTLSFDEIVQLSKQRRKVAYRRPVYNPRAERTFRTYIERYEREQRERAKKDKKGFEKKLNFCPPCIESILNRPCAEGARNNTAAVMASYFKQRGYSKAKGWKLIREWNSEYANLGIKELETTFESIYNGNYTYGCSTLEQLGDCQRDKCKIGQAQKRG